MEQLRDDGHITGWRNELYPIAEGFYDEPLLLMERAATSFVGAIEYGVHINGMLDHIVAGGQPANMGLMENVIKECMEEAG
eukprot:2186022-Ditylum_brightwellii.AAC.1